MSRPKNRQVFEYYKTRNKHTLTDAYFSLNPPEHDPYEILYFEFCTRDFFLPEDKALYKVLDLWQNRNTVIFDNGGHTGPRNLICAPELSSRLDDLTTVTDLNLLQPNKNLGGIANQKWHLYVGVLMYLRICGSSRNGIWNWNRYQEYQNLDYPFGTYPSKVLRLWMTENTDGYDSEIAEIKETIDQCLSLKESYSGIPSDEYSLQLNKLNGKTKTTGLINELFIDIMNGNEIGQE